MKNYQRIFVAIDGSPTQTKVIERALTIAEANNAEILLGHVVDSVPFESTGTDFRALVEERQSELESELQDVLKQAKTYPHIQDIKLDVKAGHINNVLQELMIDPYDPDLVICGERGLSNLQYAFIGSVSTFLIRNLRCDVLVVKNFD